MEKLRFKGTFNLLDYNISHKVLLIRNNDSYESQGPNIDIIFESVFYIDIVTRLRDIVLYEGDHECFKKISMKSGGDYSKESGQTVFILESDDKKYYIGCWRFIIQENNLNPLVSSIK